MRPSRTRLVAPPRLEALEDRCLLAAGSLDPTFGTGGLVVTAVTNPGYDAASDLVIQPDGKILAAGTSGGDFALVRYNANGTRDGSFGTNGVVTTDLKANDGARSVALLADGRIVAAGYSETLKAGVYQGRLALARYLPNGALDTTFGSRGKVTTDLGSGRSDAINDLKIQSDGKIVVVGKTSSFPDGDNFLVARYTASGRLDSTFGNGGVVYTDFLAAPTADDARGVAIQSDGKLVVVGKSAEATGSGAVRFAMARYNTNGTLDDTFGTGGVLTSAIGPWSEAVDVKLLADGRILVAGTSDGNYAVARYLADGGLDPTFGSGGVSTGPEVPEGYFWGTGMALQANGKVLVSGRIQVIDGSHNFALVRLNADGSLDTTFGAGGGLTTDFHPTAALTADSANAVVVQADGAIVVAGYTRVATTGAPQQDFALARYLGDGSPLQAAATASGPAAPSLTRDQLQPLVAEALARWEATGLTPAELAALRSATITVGDLGANYLGMAYAGAGRIVIDDDAARWGWFIDPTPWDNGEFLTPGDQGERGRMDLLTTLMHEMGHLLGREDIYDPASSGELMYGYLAAGERRGLHRAPAEAVELPVDAALAAWQAPDRPALFRGDLLALLEKNNQRA